MIKWALLILLGISLLGCGGIASKDNIDKITLELSLSDGQRGKLQKLLRSFEAKLLAFDREKRKLKLKLSDMVGEDHFNKVEAKSKITGSVTKIQTLLDEMVEEMSLFYGELDSKQKKSLKKLIQKYVEDNSTDIL